jgi:hypothetical protein
MMPVHTLTTTDGELRWQIDTTAIAAQAAWAARDRAALMADIDGMARYFPHWILAAAQGGRPARCGACRLPLVPLEGALRCPACHIIGRGDGLLWMGQLPAIMRVEPQFARRRAALRSAGFAEVAAGGLDYLLVPITIAYPHEWPHVEPAVRYAGRWLDALGLPRYSAAHHVIGDGQACLFAWGQWEAMPIHSVLQQRVVNHVASLLKIAAGMPPHAAFIGRDHNRPWQPE